MNIPAEWLAYGALAVVFGVMISLLITQRTLRRALEAQEQRNQSLESKIDSLTQQLAMLNKGTLGMGKRLMKTEKRLNQTMERLCHMGCRLVIFYNKTKTINGSVYMASC